MSVHPLRAFRARKGITLDELAVSVGISKPSLSRIETGRQSPAIGTIRKLIAISSGELTANDFVGSASPETEGDPQ